MTELTALSLAELSANYRAGMNPADLMAVLDAREADWQDHNIWIHRLTPEERQPYLDRLAEFEPDSLPLYGIPFAIKDNIDLRGIPTTAACPEYSYIPEQHAVVVARLIEAGAIPLGKTNLDQFATGLVGTRSPKPWGPCKNSFDKALISGGSSSGSAVAVAAGLASFSLGTDTAGSGRVPAAFNNLIGVKPSLGLLSNEGVVPACRTIDSVSVFSLTAIDAAKILEACCEQSTSDRVQVRNLAPGWPQSESRLSIPLDHQLVFDSDDDQHLFEKAISTFSDMGFAIDSCDFSFFFETAKLLYEGPWLAERYTVIDKLLSNSPEAVEPVVRDIVSAASEISAVETFEALYVLKDRARECKAFFEKSGFAMTPTTPGLPSIDAVMSDPIALNSRLGHYTNFMNLLDLAAIALPAGFTPAGTPRGFTLFGPAGTDPQLLRLGSDYLNKTTLPLGATKTARTPEGELPIPASHTTIAVCGAHMSGLPLNHQLTDLGAYYLRTHESSADYRLFALPGGPPERPGLLRVNENGYSIALEEWAIPISGLGKLVTMIPSPLSLGTITLADGQQCIGFICEEAATSVAKDISEMGGWRNYLAS